MDTTKLTAKTLASVFDHTFLKAYATHEDFDKLCREASLIFLDKVLSKLKESAKWTSAKWMNFIFYLHFQLVSYHLLYCRL